MGIDETQLVDYDRTQGNFSLFTMGGILMELSELLGNQVDLVVPNYFI